jgi:hypothetical protein
METPDIEQGTALGTRIVSSLLDECRENGPDGAFELVGALDVNQARWALLTAVLALDDIRTSKRTAGWN